LNPLENILAIINHKNPDRIPITMLETEHAIKIANVSYQKFATDPEILSSTLINSTIRYRYDWIWVYVSDWIEFESIGAKIEHNHIIPPKCIEFAIKDDTILDDIEMINPWEDDNMSVILRGIELIKKQIGDELMICGRVAFPFTSAILMRGINKGFIDLYRREEYFKKLMNLGLKLAISFSKAQLEAGAHALWVGDVFASSRFISQEYYLRHALPYERILINEIRRLGGISFIFHDEISTDRLIVESKVEADVIGIGNDTNIREARKELGDNVCLSGNIDPVKILLQGSVNDVIKSVIKCIQDAGINGSYLLNTGECVCRETPPENIEAFVNTARKFENT
jgi:uroporphyrinogen decarboxylase